MAVKRRVIWMDDEGWAKAQERAKALDLSVSAYLRKLIEWRQPGPIYVETGARGKDPLEPITTAEQIARTSAFTAFRPVPKPGQKGK